MYCVKLKLSGSLSSDWTDTERPSWQEKTAMSRFVRWPHVCSYKGWKVVCLSNTVCIREGPR